MELEQAVAQLRSTVRDLNKLIGSLEKMAAADHKSETKIAKPKRKAADT